MFTEQPEGRTLSAFNATLYHMKLNEIPHLKLSTVRDYYNKVISYACLKSGSVLVDTLIIYVYLRYLSGCLCFWRSEAVLQAQISHILPIDEA